MRLIRHATSFGAVESTIERRAAIAGREHLPAGLLRLSVGIEHVEDIWDDLNSALTQTTPTWCYASRDAHASTRYRHFWAGI